MQFKFLNRVLLVLFVFLTFPTFSKAQSFTTIDNKGVSITCIKTEKDKFYKPGIISANGKFVSTSSLISAATKELKRLQKDKKRRLEYANQIKSLKSTIALQKYIQVVGRRICKKGPPSPLRPTPGPNRGFLPNPTWTPNPAWTPTPTATATLTPTITPTPVVSPTPTPLFPNPLVDFGELEPSASGKTYYVSGAGYDYNDGLSPAQAFRNLQQASNLTQPGDTVLVMDGIYTQPLFITRSGTSNNWIRYRALSGHKPHIKLGVNWGGIMVAGAAYILIEGFTVEGNAPNISLEYARQNMNNLNNPVTTGNCIEIKRHSLSSQRSHHVIVRKNHAFNCPGGGIESYEADYIRFDENLVHHNGFYSPLANSGMGMYHNWDSDNNYSFKMFFRRNVIYKNENKIPDYYSGPFDQGSRMITGGNGIIIDGTRNVQNGNLDGSLPYHGGTLVENNLIFDNGGPGFVVHLYDHVLVRGNTSYQNGRTKEFENNKRISWINSDFQINYSPFLGIYGNIIVARPDSKSISVNGSLLRNLNFENNIHFGGEDLTHSLRIGNFRVDPMFVNASVEPTLANFRLRPTSPAIDRWVGHNSGVLGNSPSIDIEGVRRPQGLTSDLGAYELQKN